MTEIRKEPGQGTILRGADGALYFIREEIMQACKITEPECLEACKEVLDNQGGDVQGYDFTSQPVSASLVVKGPIASPQGSPIGSRIGNVASTVMCPWSIGKQFGGDVSNPAAR
jgi:hypothetical protein